MLSRDTSHVEAFELQRFLLAISQVFSLSSSVGLQAALHALEQLIDRADRNGAVDHRWGACARAAQKQWETESGATLAGDWQAAVSLENIRLDVLLRPLPPMLSSEELLGADLIRLTLILSAISVGKSYPIRTFVTLSSLLKGDSLEKREVLELFSKEEAIWMSQVQDRFGSVRLLELANTVSAHIGALRTFPSRLLSHRAEPTSNLESLATKGIKLQSRLASQPRAELKKKPRKLAKSDFIGMRLQRLQFTTAKEFSGVEVLWRYQQPVELERLLCDLAARWDAQDKVAIAIGVTFFLGVMPGAFEHLRLAPGVDTSLWLDVSGDGFRWDLRVIAAGHTLGLPQPCISDPWVVFVPLPRELAEALKNLLRAEPEASSFSDLLGHNSEKLKSAMRQQLRSLSDFSHPYSCTRLSQSFGRYLLGIARDEALAATLSGDVTIGSISQAHYFVLQPAQANSVLYDAYRSLGLSGDFNRIDSERRLHQVQIDELIFVWSRVNSALAEVRAIFERFPPNLGVNRAIEFHNKISVRVALLLFCVTGHRPAQELSFQAHAICLERGSVLVSDKETSRYHQFREVPIPPAVCAWVDFYFRWLRKLVGYLAKRQDNLAPKVASLLAKRGTKAAAPLFFTIESGRIKPISTSKLVEFFS